MYLGNLVEVLPGKDLDMKANASIYKSTDGCQYLIINMDFSKPIESIESESSEPVGSSTGMPVPGKM